jgi:hypothetical protein
MEPDLEKQSPFYFFKKLFKKNKFESVDASQKAWEPSPSEKAAIAKEKKEIEEQISLIIENDNKQQLNVLVDNGVILSESNIIKILNYRPEMITSKVVNMMTEHYEKPVKSAIYNAFKNFNEVVGSGEDYYSVNLNSSKGHARTRYVNTAKFLNDYLMTFYKNDKASITQLYHLNENIGQNIRSLNHKSFIGSATSYQDTLSNKLERLYNEVSQDSILHLAYRAKMLDDNNLKKNMAHTIIEQIDKYDPKKLPVSAQNLLKEVNQLFLDIQDLKLNQEQQFNIDNLYKKRLPQIVSEYLTIPERFRKQLNHQTDNPDTLLLDSLNEIKVIINGIGQDINQENLKTMKISNAYLKSMKN